MRNKNKKIIEIVASMAPSIGVLTMFILRHGPSTTQTIIGIIIIILELPMILLLLVAYIRGFRMKGLFWGITMLFVVFLGGILCLFDQYLKSKGISDKSIQNISPTILMIIMLLGYNASKSYCNLEKRKSLKKKVVLATMISTIFQLMIIWSVFFKKY